MSLIGASIGGSAINAAASIANAQNSWSNSNGSSWNSGGGYNVGNMISDSESYGIGDAYGYGYSESGNYGASRTYGREASAQDIQNAREANQVQRDLWSMQADYNAKQAQIDREYQTYMSNTAYQRAVIDLLSAGLNPILAVGNMGASTPVGAMASSGLGSANKANAYAEQESYQTGYSTSKSYNESHERSGSKSHSESSNYGSEWNSGGSTQTSQSETTTQLKELSNIIRDLTKGGSAKTQANKSPQTNGNKLQKFANDFKTRSQHHITK